MVCVDNFKARGNKKSEEKDPQSDKREDSLRISNDTKAKVDLFDSSRGGASRCKEAVPQQI